MAKGIVADGVGGEHIQQSVPRPVRLRRGRVSVGELMNAWNRKHPGKEVGFALRVEAASA